MKRDWRLYAAFATLVALLLILIYISLEKKKLEESNQTRVNGLIDLVEQIRKNEPIQPVNGKTPVLGVDYFNGQNGQSVEGPRGETGNTGADGESAYQIAVRNGFVGTESEWIRSLKGEKGDTGAAGRDVELACDAGVVLKKFSLDDFWQSTNIRCEVAHE